MPQHHARHRISEWPAGADHDDAELRVARDHAFELQRIAVRDAIARGRGPGSLGAERDGDRTVELFGERPVRLALQPGCSLVAAC